jgi:hypothetical protein
MDKKAIAKAVAAFTTALLVVAILLLSERLLFVIGLWSALGLVLIGLALPPALLRKSWLWFLASVVLVFAGIVLPLFVFVMSAFLVPDWRGDCLYGWLDCFHPAKLALTPLVLWACAAFYAHQVLRPADRHRSWIVLGLLSGAIVSGVCLAAGLMVHAFREWISLWLLVPLYVAIWYAVLSVLAIKASTLGAGRYIASLSGSIPLWFASIFWSRQIYLSLPDTRPDDCFVVSAALRGHEMLVGPIMSIHVDDGVRRANSQLLAFWHLEAIWRARSPRTHRAFRRIYGRLGPLVARRIRTRLAADAVYLALKPFEWAARAIVTRSGGRGNGGAGTRR